MIRMIDSVLMLLAISGLLLTSILLPLEVKVEEPGPDEAEEELEENLPAAA